MTTRIIGLGQRAAGNDAAGLAVLEALRRRGLPGGAEVVEARDATALVSLLQTPATVVVVDAVLASPPGEVLDLSPSDLAAGAPVPVSTHGLGVGQAIELARITAPDRLSPDIRIVGVSIGKPCQRGSGRRAPSGDPEPRALDEPGLSPDVAAAVPRAVARVLSFLGG
ncbi:Hydrogenase expression/formation protein hupD [Sorangium cellulosum So ce56]|uniref:Hydrogenase expression/formation protein hupD n=1 Tax=Sorangium cellulosum (strain So ce56) TaxID=448385 RepID=A9F9C2_SORC5|nr:hydrogenase maturation protease [Sorangium cellulosum]CAN94739.1 Hydrogenase expression/formation protein hupD [Sorangium cellulosum So ce56]